MIFIDTNVLSEAWRRNPDPAVMAWLGRHDAELALSTVAIAEIAFGIDRIREDQRSLRLAADLSRWRQRFAGRIFGLTEEAALRYGEIMGAASRTGVNMSAPDGMIAAIASVNGGHLATRNVADFQNSGLTIINPWIG